MNPQAILTPGGIADQLTNGLSGFALAMQRRREQDSRDQQQAIENQRSQGYLDIAQRNAQTGSSNQQYEFARQGRLDERQAREDALLHQFDQQENVSRDEKFQMDRTQAAQDFGYGAGRPLQPGMSSLAEGLGVMSGNPRGAASMQSAMSGDRFPEQNQLWRDKISLERDELGLKRDTLAAKLSAAKTRQDSMRIPGFEAVYRQQIAKGRTPMSDDEVLALTGFDRMSFIANNGNPSHLYKQMDPETAYAETMRILSGGPAPAPAPAPDPAPVAAPTSNDRFLDILNRVPN